MEQSKYTFHFTEKELREFSFRAVADVYCKRPSLWLILLILCAVDFLIVPVFSIVLLFFCFQQLLLMWCAHAVS